MNEQQKNGLRGQRMFARRREQGFTLMEILVALAIVGIIIGITAAALGGRATTTRLQSVASQIAQTIQGRQQLFINDLRSAKVDTTELATELATTFAGSTIVTAAVATGSPCVGTATPVGITFTVATLDMAEATALQALISTAVDDVFADRVATADGSYFDVFDTTDAADAWVGGTLPATALTDDPTGAGITTVNLCIDSD